MRTMQTNRGVHPHSARLAVDLNVIIVYPIHRLYHYTQKALNKTSP